MTTVGAMVNVPNADWALMEPALAVLSQDANGADTYSNERAMVGHLEAKYNLVIDKETHDHFTAANEIKVDLKGLGEKNGIGKYLGTSQTAVDHKAAHSYIARYSTAGNEALRTKWVTKLAALNFASLRDAGIESKPAFLMAALRARWVATGAYGVTKQDNAATYNEVTVVDAADARLGIVVRSSTSREVVEHLGKYSAEFRTEYKSEAHGMKYVTKHAENFFAAVEHAFRVRNHHFKDQKEFLESYTSLYMRFLEAAYEGQFEWPEGVSMYEVFRLAIHPFKLKALPVMMAHYAAWGKIANAAITRTSGSPCGCATITTTVAALDTMKAESWWTSFVKAYGSVIDEATAYANQINSNKYAYHMSAALYGVEKISTLKHKEKTVTVEEAKSRISLLASACQGMINALEVARKAGLIKKFALANARALVKPAAANPLLSLRITMLVTSALNAIEEAGDIKTAIANALPQLEADSARKKPVAAESSS